VSLTLQGLRSWRTETTISFEDLSLVAIVGPTGAGKSSLLEALTYALYSATTWDGSAVKDLITTGEHTMTVKLVFRAGGGEWAVTRSVSRTSNPPPTHLLEGPDEPNGSRNRYDGQQAVTAKVEQLLGVDRTGFLRTVVLPQGKFQTLLHASTADRVTLLTGILGLGIVEKVASQAGLTADALTSRHEQLLTSRGLLPADPVADLAAAELEVARLEPLVERLERARRDHRHALQQAGDQLVAAAAAGVAAREIAKRLTPDHRTTLAGTVVALEELGRELEAVAREEAALDREREPIDMRLVELSEDGLTPATVAAAASALADAEALPALHVAQREAREHLDGLGATHETAIAAGERALEELTTTARHATGEHDQAEHDVEEAAGGHARIAALAAELARLTADIEVRSAELDVAREELRDAAALEVQAAARATLATTELTAAEERRHAALSADGVAAIAHALHAGDDCPVCERALPAGWAAPPGGAAAAAAAAVAAARAAYASAREFEQAAHARARSLTNDVDDLAARLARLNSNCEEAALALGDRALAPDDRKAIDRIVDGARRRLAQVREREAQAREARAAARDDLHDGQRALDGLRETHERELRHAREDLDQPTARIAELTARLDRAPAALRPADATSAEQIAIMLERAQQTRSELDRLAADGKRLNAAAKDLATRRRDVDTRSAAHGPAIERARGDLRLLHEAVDPDDAAGLRAVQEAEPAVLRRLAGELHAGATDRITELDVRERDARTAAGGHEERATAILTTLAVEHPGLPLASADDLVAVVATRKSELAIAAGQCAVAREAIPACAALDAELGRVVARRAACQRVRALTARSKFPAWLIARREELLLGIASDILGRLTRDRYGFTRAFKVVDRDAGEARNPKTLSGGETFLASLALAFALVEMTGRSGVRIDCLFLDEGFGSLSTSALDTALDALGSQAIGDRLIAVISHVPEVADRVETVIEISQTADGNSRYCRRDGSIDPGTLALLEAAAR